MTVPAEAIAAEIERLTDTCLSRSRLIAERLAALGEDPAGGEPEVRAARARERARELIAGASLGALEIDPGDDPDALAIERDALAMIRRAARGVPKFEQSPAPPPALADVRAMIRRLPLADREQLAHLFTPSHLRAARLAERDAAILELVAGRPGNASELARWVHDKLARYRLGQWRFDHGQTAPFDPRNRILHRILALTNGQVPEVNTLRKIVRS